MSRVESEPQLSAIMVAWYGAELGAAADFAYALAFILYALARSTYDLLATPAIDAGWLNIAIATWLALAVPAFLLAALFAPIVMVFGALTALLVKVVLAARNPSRASRRAVALGVTVCAFVVIVILALLVFGMGLTWRPAIAETLAFWIVLPLVLYVVAGGIGGWELNQMEAK
jgi:hypothetical protein